MFREPRNRQKAHNYQDEYLQLLLRGASPVAACTQLSLDYFEVMDAISSDEELARKVDAVQNALSQNVAARLYQEAMKGNVSAMTNWLKHRLPPEWPQDHPLPTDQADLELLSNEELLRLARLENIEVPAELETDFETESPPAASSSVPATVKSGIG